MARAHDIDLVPEGCPVKVTVVEVSHVSPEGVLLDTSENVYVSFSHQQLGEFFFTVGNRGKWITDTGKMPLMSKEELRQTISNAASDAREAGLFSLAALLIRAGKRRLHHM
jgi:hypothetical protein